MKSLFLLNAKIVIILGPLSSILLATQIDSLVDVPEELCDLNPQVKFNNREIWKRIESVAEDVQACDKAGSPTKGEEGVHPGAD